MNKLRPALALLLAATLSASSGSMALAATAGRPQSRTAASPASADRAAAESAATVIGRQLIVRLKGRVTSEKLEQIYDSADTSAGAVGVVRGDVLSWRIPAGESAAGFAAELEQTGKVEYADPNYVRQLAVYTPPEFVAPNDPAYLDSWTRGYQDSTGTWLQVYPHAKSWWIRDVNGVAAWQKGYTGSNVIGRYPLRASGAAIKVGVIDTGVYLKHPDAGANIVAGSSDVEPVALSEIPGDDLAEQIGEAAHGTCVSGIIGATAGNGVGTLGVGRDTTVAMYKVYYGGAGIDDMHVISALHEAADDGCKVINLSIAGGPTSSALQAAIDYAWNKGCVIVAASGNSSSSSVSFPAACNNVVAVGALWKDAGANSQRASFSNYGNALDISAPGSWIWGLTKPGYTSPDDGASGYQWWDGTSMASPIVAGGIAWLWRAMPDLSNSEIVELVERSAKDLGAVGADEIYGHGELDLAAAYDSLTNEYPLLQQPLISANFSADGRTAELSWTHVAGYGVTYDVTVDGQAVATGLSGTSLPVSLVPTITSLRYSRGQLLWGHSRADAQHDVTVTPRSPRNWTDGSEKATKTISVPGSGSHTDSLSIDGQPVAVTDDGTNGYFNTSGLSLGEHTATLQVIDGLGNVSEPKTLAFTVRPAPTVKRITGSDRYRYATALSRSTFATASTAVLVGSGHWVDALAAAPLAHLVRGPVLPTSRTSLPSTTKSELTRLGVTNIIIVGNTDDVSTSLRRSLAKRYAVSRISGSDRYETADAVARAIAKRSGGTVPDGGIVVTGDSFTAAVSASAVAARKGWPLLYSRSSKVPRSTRSTVAAIGATKTLIVGSTKTVSTSAREQLPGAERIADPTFLATPTKLATWATSNHAAQFSGEQIYLANNTGWAAALGLPAAAAEKGGLVVLTTSALTTPVKRYYQSNSEVAVTTRIVAGTSTISTTSLRSIKSILGAP